MSDFPNVETEIAKLGHLLKLTSGLRDISTRKLRSRVGRLRMRLKSPVRIAIVGLPKSGKSVLVNFLAGTDAVPVGEDGDGLPSFSLAYHDRVTTTAGWWDGRKEISEGLAVQQAAQSDPEYIRITLPKPILNDIGVFELSGSSQPRKMAHKLAWMAERADIMLWCTPCHTPWTDQEARLWDAIPDTLKDRSFLVATGADTVRPAANLRNTLVQLQDRAGDHFHSLIPIATPRAIKAAPGGVVADTQLFAASGGKALITTLLSHAKLGRQADLDSAHLLLAQHADLIIELEEAAREEEAAPAEPEPQPSAEAEVSPPETEDALAPEAEQPSQAEQVMPTPPATEEAQPEPETPSEETPPEPETASTDEAASETPSEAMPEPDPVPEEALAHIEQAPVEIEAPSETVPPSEPAAQPAEDVVVEAPEEIETPTSEEEGATTAVEQQPSAEDTDTEEAVERPEIVVNFILRARDLADRYIGGEEFDIREFVQSCGEIVEEIAESVSDPGVLVDGAEWIPDQLDEASEILILMQSEDTEQTAEDAVRIMLQIGRDLTWASAA